VAETRFPARLHVLLAADGRTGVVIRRGPSRAVATVQWDRRRDRFTMGQWLRGRIYERRADLSPDGRHLIYFAMDGRWKSETRGSWTAVSRAPFLKAIVLFGKGDCWNGGGLFTDRRQFWLNDGWGHEPLRSSSEVRRDTSYEPPASYGGECPHVYYNRLQRDGWVLRENGRTGAVFERSLAHGWILRKHARASVRHPPGRGCYWDEHEIVPPGSGPSRAFPAWEWADRDGDDVVFAEAGGIYRMRLRQQAGPDRVRLLHDFNAMTFEPLAAPY
jgi:hypothetical protein